MGILVPRPESELGPAVRAQSPNPGPPGASRWASSVIPVPVSKHEALDTFDCSHV